MEDRELPLTMVQKLLGAKCLLLAFAYKLTTDQHKTLTWDYLSFTSYTYIRHHTRNVDSVKTNPCTRAAHADYFVEKGRTIIG